MRGDPDRCPNLNHVRTNPSVRFCPECGRTVNGAIHPCTCNPKKHAMERWNRNRFCSDCGLQVMK